MKVYVKLWTQHTLDQELGGGQTTQRVALSSSVSTCITGLCEPQFSDVESWGNASFLLCSVAGRLAVYITKMVALAEG